MRSTHYTRGFPQLRPYLARMSDAARERSEDPPETPEGRADRLAWEWNAIQEALASLERDGAVPFEEVEAWIDSWGTPNELSRPEPRK